jgi:hypothetical protein
MLLSSVLELTPFPDSQKVCARADALRNLGATRRSLQDAIFSRACLFCAFIPGCNSTLFRRQGNNIDNTNAGSSIVCERRYALVGCAD